MSDIEDYIKKKEIIGSSPQLIVYLDSRGILTVGFGHKVTSGDNLRLGDVITEQRADQLFRQDFAPALSAAQSQASQAGIADKDFLKMLTSTNFQLGTNWRSDFKNAWQAILSGNYREAAEDITNSKWYKQTPDRAKDLQDVLKALADAADKKAKPAVEWTAAQSIARGQAATLGITDDDVKAAMASVISQLGQDWNQKTPELRKAWDAMKSQDYNTAQDLVKQSSWAKQNPRKAQDFIHALGDLAEAQAAPIVQNLATKRGVKNSKLIAAMDDLLAQTPTRDKAAITKSIDDILSSFSAQHYQDTLDALKGLNLPLGYSASELAEAKAAVQSLIPQPKKSLQAGTQVDAAKAKSKARDQAAKLGSRNSRLMDLLAKLNEALGTDWTDKQKDIWQAMQQGNFKQAANQLSKTAWARQNSSDARDLQSSLSDLQGRALT